jgi:hypothetical protein
MRIGRVWGTKKYSQGEGLMFVRWLSILLVTEVEQGLGKTIRFTQSEITQYARFDHFFYIWILMSCYE